MAEIDKILLKYICVYGYSCHEVALYLYRLLKTESLVFNHKKKSNCLKKKKNLVCEKAKILGKLNSS